MILPFLFKLFSADCTNNQCDIKEKLIGELMKSQKGEFSEKIEIRQGEYGLLGFSFYSSYLKKKTQFMS